MSYDATNQSKRVARPVSQTVGWRLSPLARKIGLVVHIVAGIGWMGVDIALLALLITVNTTNDPILVSSGLNAVRMIVPYAVPPLSLAILASGLVLGFGSRWGIVRYWWVFVKLVLAAIMATLVFVALLPAVNGIAVLAANGVSAAALRASLGDLPTSLLFPPGVSLLMLGIAAVLSIFKPWKTTPWSRAGAAERASEV